MKLTLDQRSKETIHFLDVDIEIRQTTLRTTVYRKPGATPIIIPKWSNDPWRYKKAALKAYIDRANTHCSDSILRDKKLET